jgi:glycosyltransferase involved in cell wall biosynthesis
MEISNHQHLLRSIAQGVSVIICCHNSENRIAQTLLYLSRQKLHPQVPYEVLIVDNRCTDRTVEVSKNAWEASGSPFPLIVCKEDRPGQAFARLAGAQNANYSVVVFCDDDNWLNGDYLVESYELMKLHSDAGIIGGKTTAEFESPPPDWFHEVCGAFAIGGATRSGRIEHHDAEVFGAGMVVRTSFLKILLSHGYTPLNAGRTGNILTAGDDSELCILARFMGLEVYESKSLCLKHFMPQNRLSWQNTLKLYRGFGASYKPNLAMSIYRKRTQVIRTVVRCSGIYTFLCFLKYHFKPLFLGQLLRFRPGDPKALSFEKAKGAVTRAFYDIPHFKRTIQQRLLLLASLDNRKPDESQ